LKFEFLTARSKYLFFKKSAQKQENQGFQAIADILKEYPEPGKICQPNPSPVFKKIFPKNRENVNTQSMACFLSKIWPKNTVRFCLHVL
jgi:hypothetical protein